MIGTVPVEIIHNLRIRFAFNCRAAFLAATGVAGMDTYQV